MFHQIDFWEYLPTSEPIDDLDVIRRRFTAKQRQYLHGPIIQYRSGGWTFPTRLRPLVPQARLQQVLHGADDCASELEALGYLSTASLDFPLSSEWAQILFWLADRVLPRYGLLPDDAMSLADVLGMNALSITPYQEETFLLPLRRWLRKTIVKHAAVRK